MNEQRTRKRKRGEGSEQKTDAPPEDEAKGIGEEQGYGNERENDDEDGEERIAVRTRTSSEDHKENPERKVGTPKEEKDSCILSLPNEILFMVIGFLDLASRSTFRCTCSRMRYLQIMTMREWISERVELTLRSMGVISRAPLRYMQEHVIEVFVFTILYKCLSERLGDIVSVGVYSYGGGLDVDECEVMVSGMTCIDIVPRMSGYTMDIKLDYDQRKRRYEVSRPGFFQLKRSEEMHGMNNLLSEENEINCQDIVDQILNHIEAIMEEIGMCYELEVRIVRRNGDPLKMGRH